MKYKDKLKMPIKIEKKKREEILETISKINREINLLRDKIEKNNNQAQKNMEDLMSGKSNSSLFFGYQMDIYEKTDIEKRIVLLEKEKKQWILEQDMIKKKIEKMEEEQSKRKKIFEKEKTKKEEKETEELKMINRAAKEDAYENTRYTEFE